MTDIRANWDPHDGQGRSPDRRERDVRTLGVLGALMVVGVPLGVALIGAYYLLEKLFGIG